MGSRPRVEEAPRGCTTQALSACLNPLDLGTLLLTETQPGESVAACGRRRLDQRVQPLGPCSSGLLLPSSASPSILGSSTSQWKVSLSLQQPGKWPHPRLGTFMWL